MYLERTTGGRKETRHLCCWLGLGKSEFISPGCHQLRVTLPLSAPISPLCSQRETGLLAVPYLPGYLEVATASVPGPLSPQPKSNTTHDKAEQKGVLWLTRSKIIPLSCVVTAQRLKNRYIFLCFELSSFDKAFFFPENFRRFLHFSYFVQVSPVTTISWSVLEFKNTAAR